PFPYATLCRSRGKAEGRGTRRGIMGGEPAQRRRLRASQLAAGVGLCLALSASAVCAAAKAPVWAQLTADQKTVLRPLQPEWDRLPQLQRSRLLPAAKRYPRMSAQQPPRFS